MGTCIQDIDFHPRRRSACWRTRPSSPGVYHVERQTSGRWPGRGEAWVSLDGQETSNALGRAFFVDGVPRSWSLSPVVGFVLADTAGSLASEVRFEWPMTLLAGYRKLAAISLRSPGI